MSTSMIALLATLTAATALTSPLAFAAGDAGASLGLQTVRPPGYKPLAGDAKLGEKLFHDTKLSSNGMSCATCHANNGAYQASFAQPYPHTVAMARDQLGRKSVHLDEMIQACMLLPMASQPLPWNSKELAALVSYVRIQQKAFRASK